VTGLGDSEIGLNGIGATFRGRGELKADPMSLRVSERTRMRMVGAIEGTWHGESGG
jgi:hypothetical protein